LLNYGKIFKREDFKMTMDDKRGISPVVATVLLIGIVVIAAVVIFIALSGLKTEVITKFGRSADSVCLNEVRLRASYSGSSLTITNTGTTGIYSVSLIKNDGETKTEVVSLAKGRSTTISVQNVKSIVPIIRGVNEEGDSADFECSDIKISVV
jgi:flagellin-like protein